MWTRRGTILAGLLCALAVSLLPSRAHAEPEVVLAFRAGAIAGAKIQAGDEGVAGKLMATWVKTIQLFLVDNKTQESYWGIWKPAGSQRLALALDPEWDEEAGVLRFEGRLVSGAFDGAKVSGQVVRDARNHYTVTTRVQRNGQANLDVTFSQPLEPIEVRFGKDQDDPEG
jgi:hypothetical protein